MLRASVKLWQYLVVRSTGAALSRCFFLSTILGCGTGELQLPDGISGVVLQKERVAHNDADPILEMATGLDGEELSTLSGCWGTYFTIDLFGLTADDFEYYKFDMDSGSLRYEILTIGPGSTQTLVVHNYDLQIIDSSDIRIVLTSAAAASNTGLPQAPLDLVPVDFDSIEVAPVTLRIHTDSDKFVIVDVPGATPEAADTYRRGIVVHRIECSDEEPSSSR